MKVIFFNIPAYGHINPTIPVITELVRRGEQVTYVDTEEFRTRIEATGAVFQPYPDLDVITHASRDAGKGNIPRNALALTRIADAILPWMLDLLRDENPDYIIHDSLSAWAGYAARKLRIPAIASVTTFIISTKALPPVSVPALATLAGQLAVRMPGFWRTAWHMHRAYGVQLKSIFDSVMSLGALNIVFTSALFQPDHARFGPEFKFVGPALALAPSPGDPPPWPFDTPIARPLVYVSLGTLNNDNPAFYRACFEAFASHPGQFVLSAGRKTDIAALGAIPANFIVRNSVPQLDVLQHADLFITHGGMNSVQEALYFGVPLIVVPQQVEQAIVARRVAGLGVGVALGLGAKTGRVNATELRRAFDQILHEIEPYQHAANRLGESFRSAGGAMRAADEILAFARRG